MSNYYMVYTHNLLSALGLRMFSMLQTFTAFSFRVSNNYTLNLLDLLSQTHTMSYDNLVYTYNLLSALGLGMFSMLQTFTAFCFRVSNDYTLNFVVTSHARSNDIMAYTYNLHSALRLRMFFQVTNIRCILYI